MASSYFGISKSRMGRKLKKRVKIAKMSKLFDWHLVLLMEKDLVGVPYSAGKIAYLHKNKCIRKVRKPQTKFL